MAVPAAMSGAVTAAALTGDGECRSQLDGHSGQGSPASRTLMVEAVLFAPAPTETGLLTPPQKRDTPQDLAEVWVVRE
jgi:hypothetical protein